DFTFPATWREAQPSIANTIYDATDDAQAKSYNYGVRLRVGQKPTGDLMIFQGPLVVVGSWDILHMFTVVEDANIHSSIPLAPWRMDAWVRANIHVEGRPEWVFVKLSGHAGASRPEADATLGSNFDSAMSYLEQHYNDGKKYILHYVTAREAYNLARAAQAGQSGDPVQFYNWEVKPYLAG